jgi:hypothetical protein
MRIPILGVVLDERFLSHRQRSTSLASVIGAMAAVGLFAYRYFMDGIWSWDLFAVAATIVVVKLALMAWYLLTD